MTNKCKGCGILLQSSDPQKAGYVLKDGQEYCQRCYRLIHYGERKDLGKRYVKDKDVLEIYEKYSSDAVVLVIDVYEALFSDLRPLIAKYRGHKVIFLFSKADLLPEDLDRQIVEERLESVVRQAAKETDVIDVLLTSSKDPDFPSFFQNILTSHGLKKAVFAGRANAGKSTLINRLLGNDDLTVSRYPGTTLDDIEIHQDGFTYIDTPGLYDPENILAYIPLEKVEKLVLKECPKARNFQIYEEQSYFVEGLLRIDIKPKKESTLIVRASPELDIHRTKPENAERYFERNRKNLSLKFDTYKTERFPYRGDKTFYLKGLGLFRIVGEGEIALSTYDKMEIIQSEVFI